MSRRKQTVCVVGSRSFPITVEIGAEVVDLLRAYPDGTRFVTRGSEGFDRFVLRVAEVIGLHVDVYPSAGGSTNFDRDVAIVRDADEVLVFLDPRTLHRTDTGTSHVLEKALDQRKKVAAYTVGGDHLVFAGSSE